MSVCHNNSRPKRTKINPLTKLGRAGFALKLHVKREGSMYSYGEGPDDSLQRRVAFGLLYLQIPLGVGLECGDGQCQVNRTTVHQE